MTRGNHANGDYVVFLHDGKSMRGYIQKVLGGQHEPVIYVIRVDDREFDVREDEILHD